MFMDDEWLVAGCEIVAVVVEGKVVAAAGCW